MNRLSMLMVVLWLVGASAVPAYQLTWEACADGDTAAIFVGQDGPIQVPNTHAFLIWTTTVQPVVKVVTDVPMMRTETDSLGVEMEVPTGEFFTQIYLCALVEVYTTDVGRMIRLTWENGMQSTHPLDKVSVFVPGRRQ